jgi:hypothetical protein
MDTPSTDTYAATDLPAVKRGKAARVRSQATFDAAYVAVRDQRSTKRTDAANERQKERDEHSDMLDAMSPREREIYDAEKADAKIEREAALHVAYEQVAHSMLVGDPSLASKQQRSLINNHERVERLKSRGEWPPKTLAQRVSEGYRFEGGLVGGKYRQPEFVCHRFASEEHWLLKRFIASMPKPTTDPMRQPCAAGMTKSNRQVFKRKWDAAQRPYVMLRTDCADWFRVEVDASFGSARGIRCAFKKCGLPQEQWPQIIVWIWDEREGGILRPHLLWCLPEGSGVWGNLQQRRMLATVAASITAKLQPMGADAGGLANIHDTKSPLSPHCDFIVMNDRHLLTLSHHLKLLNATVEPKEIARKMALIELQAALLSDDQSNRLFSWARNGAWAIGKTLHANGTSGLSDEPTVLERIKFREMLIERLMKQAEDTYDMTRRGARRAIAKIVAQCCWYTAENFLRGTSDRGRRRGAAEHLVEARLADGTIRTAKEAVSAAQAEGGRYGAGVQRAASLKAIKNALIAAMRAGGKVTQNIIAIACGRSLRTVKEYWKVAFSLAQNAVATAQNTLASGGARQTLEKGVPLTSCPMDGQNSDPVEPPTLTGGWSAPVDRLEKTFDRPAQPSEAGSNLVQFLCGGVLAVYGSGRRLEQVRQFLASPTTVSNHRITASGRASSLTRRGRRIEPAAHRINVSTTVPVLGVRS